MGYDESVVIGPLGGGYGEPPVRVAELEEAARRHAAARRAARPARPPTGAVPIPDPDPDPARDAERFAPGAPPSLRERVPNPD